MNKRFLIIDEDDNIDYVIKVNGDAKKITYEMYRSKAHHWNKDVRGEKVITLVDNDDDISITFEENDILCLHYHQLTELHNIINIVKGVGRELDTHKTIEIDPE
jgi:hypothetical protein